MRQLVLNPNEQIFLAVDIGSNAMRACIALLDESNDLEILSSLRFPLRLGEDVFKTKKISKKKIEKTVEAFREIQKISKNFNFKQVSIVATSAIRDAENGAELTKRVQAETGFEIVVIDGQKEAQLIFQAVTSQINIKKRRSLLVDVGGGSTELTLCDGHEVIFSQSYNCGTVRLLECDLYKKQNEIINEFIAQAAEEIKKYNKSKPIDLCIGTGGNLRRMGKLRRLFFKRSNLKVTQTELSSILNEVKLLSVEKRVELLEMRQDRADVIVPATRIIEELMLQFSCHEILLPRVGLKEGVILSLLKKKPRHIYFS